MLNSRLDVGRKNRVPIGLRLRLKQIPRRHRHDPAGNSFTRQLVVCFERNRHFGTGSDQDNGRRTRSAVAEDITLLSPLPKPTPALSDPEYVISGA